MRRPFLRGVALLLLIGCVALVACVRTVGADRQGSPGAPGPTATRPVVPPDGSLQPPSGMATITLAELPPEARDTLARITAGGPYPYRQDGAIFENRERLLPGRPTGHYREFTVVTPGEGDRGARRIVTGAAGERYYTDDHYDSFRWIVP